MRYVLCLALLMAGCAEDHDNPAPSPFAGSWFGRWDDAAPDSQLAGNLTLAVTTAGELQGSMEMDNVPHATWDLIGAIAASGQLTGYYETTTGRVEITGTMTRSADVIEGEAWLVGQGGTAHVTFLVEPY